MYNEIISRLSIPAAKTIIGVVVLIVGVSMVFPDHPRKRDLYLSDVEIDRFPVLTGKTYNEKAEVQVIFVYSPGDCYLRSSMKSMKSWHRVSKKVNGVLALNVIQEEDYISAKRYISEFPTHYRTRLDSTGWFNSELDLSTTPAVILLSRHQEAEVIYPLQSGLTEADRLQRLVQF